MYCEICKAAIADDYEEMCHTRCLSELITLLRLFVEAETSGGMVPNETLATAQAVVAKVGKQ